MSKFFDDFKGGFLGVFGMIDGEAAGALVAAMGCTLLATFGIGGAVVAILDVVLGP